MPVLPNPSLPRCIDFAPLVQLHYPFSLQTHPHSFPGESPSDCARDARPARSLLIQWEMVLTVGLDGARECQSLMLHLICYDETFGLLKIVKN